MSKLRCFPILPGSPGTLHLVTLKLIDSSAPIREDCMEAALAKWHRLFCLKVLYYSLSPMGAVMLFFVPNYRLTQKAAAKQNAEFDDWIQEVCKTKRKPRSHKFTSEMLCDLSKFMQLFKPDLRERHRTRTRSQDLLPGCSRCPVYRERFTNTVIQHDALPPVFTPQEVKSIREKLKELGFEGKTTPRRDTKLHMSQHGIGTMEFLAEMEERCYIQLMEQGREPKLWKMYFEKYITPLTQELVYRRLGELILREDYDDYPKTCSLLMELDMQIDKLMDAKKLNPGIPVTATIGMTLETMCLPFALTMLLTDGLLRWYYKTTKNVEFPHYDYYSRLRDYERPQREPNTEKINSHHSRD